MYPIINSSKEEVQASSACDVDLEEKKAAENLSSSKSISVLPGIRHRVSSLGSLVFAEAIAAYSKQKILRLFKLKYQLDQDPSYSLPVDEAEAALPGFQEFRSYFLNSPWPALSNMICENLIRIEQGIRKSVEGTKIEFTKSFTVVLSPHGEIHLLGENNGSLSAAGDINSYLSPRFFQVLPGQNSKEIAGGDGYLFALTQSSELYSFLEEKNGREQILLPPIKKHEQEQIRKIFNDDGLVSVITKDGEILLLQNKTRVKSQGLEVKQICYGKESIFVLTESGKVYSFEEDADSKLDHDDEENHLHLKLMETPCTF